MTSEEKGSWYCCGHCGSIFISDFGLNEDRQCSVCSKNPRPEYLSTESAKQSHVQFEKIGEKTESDNRRKTRKRKQSNFLMKIIIGWLVVMLTALGLQYFYEKSRNNDGDTETVTSNMTKGGLADETVSRLAKALPDCHRALAGFLIAGTPEARSQYVVDPINVAAKMAVFYSLNAFPKVDVSKIRRTGQSLIRDGDEWLVFTRWQESGENGVKFDAVFRQRAGTWKLDWEHFNQWGDYPWALFLAGHGPSEGDFRLLARQRRDSDEMEQSGARMSFVLLTPIWGMPSQVGMESPEFILNRRGDEGVLLDAAFRNRAEDLSVFETTLPPMESPGIIRVRVTVKREQFGETRRFRIVKVHACHWISSNYPGFDIDTLKQNLFETN